MLFHTSPLPAALEFHPPLDPEAEHLSSPSSARPWALLSSLPATALNYRLS